MTGEAPELQGPQPAPGPALGAPEVGPPTEFQSRVSRESARLRQQMDNSSSDPTEFQRLAKATSDRLIMGDILTAMQGQDPVDTPSEYKQFAHPLIQGLHQAALMQRMAHQANSALDANPDWKAIQSEWSDIVEKPFRAKNAKLYDEPGQSDEQRLAIAQQRTPVTVDPNWIADVRARMGKLNQELMQASGGKVNVWNHPRTRYIANWMNREAEPGRAGYVTSGKQDMGLAGAALEYGVEPVLNLTSGLLDMPVKVAEGAYGIVGEMIRGLTGGAVGWSAPTSFIETADGQILPDAERLPGVLEMFQGVRAAVAGDDIAKTMAKWNADRQWARANESGFGYVVNGTALLAGSLAGLTPTVQGGKLLEGALSKTMEKGLAIVGAGGKVSAGTQTTARMLKLRELLTASTGQGIAMGMQDALMAGRPEGMMQGFLHGFEAGMVMDVIGRAGRGVESLALARKSMPKRAAQGFGLLAEAGLFTTVELAEMQGGVWDLIRNPSQQTLANWHKVAAKNVLGLLIGRGMHGMGAEVAQEHLAGERAGAQQADLAEQVLRAREAAPPEAVSRETEMPAERPPTEPVAPLEAPPTRESTEPIRGPEAPAESPELANLPPEMQAAIRAQQAPAEGDVGARLSELEAAARRGDEATFDRIEKELGPSETHPPEISARIMEAGRRLDDVVAGEVAPESGPQALQPAPEARKPNPNVNAETARQQAAMEETIAKDRELMQRFDRAMEKGGQAARDIAPILLRRLRGNDLARARKALETRLGAETLREIEAEAGKKVASKEKPAPQETEFLQRFEKGLRAGQEIGPIMLRRLKGAQRERAAELLDRIYGPGAAEGMVKAEQPLPVREKAKLPDWLPEELRKQVELQGVDVEDLLSLAETRRAAREGDVKAAMRTRELELAIQQKKLARSKSTAEQLESDLAEADQPGWIGSVRAQQQLHETPAAEGVQPVREVDIFNKMAGYRGDPIRTVQRKGRIAQAIGKASKGIKGFFQRNRDLIRYLGDDEQLAIRSHEFSHSVHRHLEGKRGSPELSDMQKLEAARMLNGYGGLSEVEIFSRMPMDMMIAESFAEYHARFLLGEPGMAQKFPHLADYFAGLMARDARVARQFQEVAALAARYRAQGDAVRLEQMIFFSDDPLTPEQRAARIAAEGTMWEKLIETADQFLIDDLAVAKRAQKEFAKRRGQDVGDIPFAEDYLRTLETLRFTEAATAANFLEHGVLIGDKRSTSLKTALQDLNTSEKKVAFGAYLVGRRMLEYQAKGMTTGRPRDSLLRALDIEAAKLGGRENAERMAREVKDFFDSLMQWAAEQGLLTQGEAEAIIENWDVYVPMVRRLQESMRSGSPKSGGGLRKVTGSTEEIEDVFEAMQQVTISVIRNANQARVMEAIYQRALGGAVAAEVEILQPGKIPKDFTVDEVLRAIESQIGGVGDKQHDIESLLGQLREALGDDAAALITLFRPNTRTPNNEPIVMHRTKQGKRVWMQLDKRIFEALQTVQHPTASISAVAALQRVRKIAAGLKMPANVVRWFATTTNLEFAARNTLRDSIMFPGYSKVKRSMLPYAGLWMYWVRGMRSLLAAGDPQSFGLKAAKVGLKALKLDSVDEATSLAYSWFTAMGGEGISFYQRSLGEMRGSEFLLPKGAMVPKRFTARGMIESARNFIEKNIGEVIDFGERSLRWEEFRSIFNERLSQGMSESQAALEGLEAAKEVMINYTRSSLIGRQLNTVIPYWNASIQGKRKVFRAFSGLDGPEAAKVAWINAASSMGVMSGLTYLLWGNEDWFKDLAPWQRFASWHLGPNIEIPKPHGIGPLITSGFDTLFAENKMTPAESLKGIVDDWIFDQFAMPTFMLPIVESLANYSFFKGRPIVPDWMIRGRIPPEQFDSYTKGWAKWASKTMWDAFGWSVSPMKLENAINQSLGSLPNRMERNIAGLGQALGFELAPDRNTLLDQIPVLSSFFRHHPHRAGITRSRFEDQVRQLEQLAGSGIATAEDRAMLESAREIKRRMSDTDSLYRQGFISNENRDRLFYELTLPFLVQMRNR